VELNVRREPENNGGTAQITQITPEFVVVAGRTPSFGKLMVEVKARRKFDGQEFSTSFTVTPQQIEKPEFPEYVYPGQTINVDPKFPLIQGELKTIIRDGDRICASSLGGAELTYTPSLSDTGKRLSLERYVNNNLFGQSYTIYVLNFPLPKIVDIVRTSPTTIEIVTQAFGMMNRERNEIVQLELDGNVAEKYLDLRGKLQDLPGSPPSRKQFFQVKPRDPNKPFVFNVVAIDKYGRRSAPRRVVAD